MRSMQSLRGARTPERPEVAQDGHVMQLMTIHFQEFIRRTDNWRRIPSDLAETFNAFAHRRIGNMPKVPRHEEIDAERRSVGDMSRVGDRPSRHDTRFKQRITQSS